MKTALILTLAVLAIQSARAVSLITLDFSGTMTDIQRQTFIDAADFWNSAITGYHLSYNYSGQIQLHGLTITASVPAIDGPGLVLGSAGPQTATYYDNNPVGQPTVALYYTSTGAMQFDSADVDPMVANNTFYGVVLHEMAHVLGIGTLWTYNTNLNGTNYNLYTTGSGQYFGSNALARWQAEFNRPGDTYVPVELAGGAGTANGHWNENDGGGGTTGIASNLTGMDFANELMTGWASSTFFLSTVTLGALEDLGYIVDYSKAGVINHFVTVPEPSSLILSMIGFIILQRRRR